MPRVHAEIECTALVWAHCAMWQALPLADCRMGRAGILVHFSENMPVYSLRERYNSNHSWMRRTNNSDTLLHGRFGSTPFRPALRLVHPRTHRHVPCQIMPRGHTDAIWA
jgi:hypothetical protein